MKAVTTIIFQFALIFCRGLYGRESASQRCSTLLWRCRAKPHWGRGTWCPVYHDKVVRCVTRTLRVFNYICVCSLNQTSFQQLPRTCIIGQPSCFSTTQSHVTKPRQVGKSGSGNHYVKLWDFCCWILIEQDKMASWKESMSKVFWIFRVWGIQELSLL